MTPARAQVAQAARAISNRPGAAGSVARPAATAGGVTGGLTALLAALGGPCPFSGTLARQGCGHASQGPASSRWLPDGDVMELTYRATVCVCSWIVNQRYVAATLDEPVRGGRPCGLRAGPSAGLRGNRLAQSRPSSPMHGPWRATALD